MARQHHFEVIVPVEGDKIYLPEINLENSAYWPKGTVYDEDYDEDSGWNVDYDEADDWAACYRLTTTLALPFKIREIYERHTSDDGWDIDIMQEVYDLLVELDIVPRLRRS
jgi:hypothetical protein